MIHKFHFTLEMFRPKEAKEQEETNATTEFCGNYHGQVTIFDAYHISKDALIIRNDRQRW